MPVGAAPPRPAAAVVLLSRRPWSFIDQLQEAFTALGPPERDALVEQLLAAVPDGSEEETHSLRAVSGPVMRSSNGRVEAMTPRQTASPTTTIA